MFIKPVTTSLRRQQAPGSFYQTQDSMKKFYAIIVSSERAFLASEPRREFPYALLLHKTHRQLIFFKPLVTVFKRMNFVPVVTDR